MPPGKTEIKTVFREEHIAAGGLNAYVERLFLSCVLERSFHEVTEQRMRIVRTGLQLRMELRADEPRMILDLYDLDETVIRQCTGDDEALVLELLPIGVVELEAMTMTLSHLVDAIGLLRMRARRELARIGADTHRAALVLDTLLALHERDDRVRRVGVELRRMGIGHAADVARELDDGALHAEAEAEERDLVLAGILDGLDLALDAAVAKAARHEDALAADEDFVEVGLGIFDVLRIDPMDLDLSVTRNAAVMQSFRNGNVRIRQFDILADNGDFDFLLRVVDLIDHLFPFVHDVPLEERLSNSV